MGALKSVFTSGTAARMQFESDACMVMPRDFRKVGRRFEKRELHQTPISFPTTPMVFAVNSEDCVAQSELSFGQIASDEIRVFGSAPRLSKPFPNEQQAGASIEEQSSRLRKWNGSGIKMMLAITKNIWSAANHVMSSHEIVGKHRNRAPT